MLQEDLIKDIRKRCRLTMNGVASTSMREQGLVYKLNFGLSIQQIKELSKRYQADRLLAEALWKEGTRELKIAATLLYPIDQFVEATANKWVAEIPNQEIREQICANLLQNLSYANTLSKQWCNVDEEAVRATGYWLLVRLLLSQKAEKLDLISFRYLWEDVINKNISTRNAALLLLKHLTRQSADMGSNILDKISGYKNSESLLEQEIYNSILFEFEYYSSR